MKKLAPVLALLCLISCISGCSSKTETEGISFSEYYQSAEEFEEIRPQLEQYFLCIQSAYENSNKKDIESFELPEEYVEARDTLSSFYELHNERRDDIINIKDDSERTAAEKKYLSTNRLLEPYLGIEAMIAGQKLLMLVSSHVENEDWFEELDDLIKASVEEYRTGTE